MRTITLFSLIFFGIGIGSAASANPVDRNGDTLFIGHSLIAFDIPSVVQAFVAHAGGTGTTAAQIINGAPLIYNWDHGADAQGVDARSALPSGRFEAVVLTEAVPLKNHLTHSASIDTAAKYHALATDANPATQVFVYETWHDLRSGTGADVKWDEGDDVPWRARLENDYSRWMSIVDGVNDQRPSGTPAVRLIPAGQAMGALSDAIEAGRVPGATTIGDLFDDSIHPNPTGAYFIALIMAASIYGIEPTTLPHRASLAWHRQYDLETETANALQTIAAEAMRDAN